jgi:hypothetical protein
MLKHNISYVLFGIGIAGLLFALVRTYYLVWKMKKEREQGGRYGKASRRSTAGSQPPEE